MNGRVFVLDFPRPDEWINANVREHWAVKAAKTRTWRAAAYGYAKAARIPHLDRAHILAELCFTSRTRRDPDNFSVKAVVDGLVDAGVLDDDDAAHLLGPDKRQGPKVTGTARLRLTITEVLP